MPDTSRWSINIDKMNEVNGKNHEENHEEKETVVLRYEMEF